MAEATECTRLHRAGKDYSTLRCTTEAAPDTTGDAPQTSFKGPAPPKEQRFLVLVLFCFMTANNGFTWFMFEPAVSQAHAKFSCIDREEVQLLASWQPLMYLLAVTYSTRVLAGPDGLRTGVRACVLLEFLGSVIKTSALFYPTRASADRFACLNFHVGQIFSACVAPCAIGAPALLSALWFEPNERTRSTGAAVLFNNVGNAAAFLMVPYLAKTYSYSGVLYWELATSILAVVLVWTLLPKTPKAPYYACDDHEVLLDDAVAEEMIQDEDEMLYQSMHMSYAQGSFAAHHPDTPEGPNRTVEDSLSRVRGVQFAPPRAHSHTGDEGAPAPLGSRHIALEALDVLKIRPVALLCCAYAWTRGGYMAMTALYGSMLGPSGLGMELTFVRWLSFWSSVAYIVGGFASAYLADVYFRFQMKRTVVFCCVCNVVVCIVFALSIPLPGPSPGTRIVVFEFGQHWILAVASSVSLFNGAMAPVFYEFAAELSHPIDEVVVGTLLSLFENVGALFLFQVIASTFSSEFMNLVFCAGMGVCVVLLVKVKEAYRRSGHDPKTPLFHPGSFRASFSGVASSFTRHAIPSQ